MATTTPNFGWSVPTSSDLVKNGATAIETLGDSIDASLVDLKGGTTGQVLSKTSNTDMDFTWSTAGGASALTLIKKVDFTTASTIDFSNSFSTTYDHYVIQGTLTSSADGDLNFRWRVSGSDNSSSNYNYQLADIVNASANNARVTAQTAGRLAATRTSSGRTSLKVELYNPFKTETKNWVGHAAVQVTSDVYINQISGGFNDNTSFTGMTVYPSSGTVSGTLRIYGYQNS
jgi:hypothetical protein